MNRQARIVLSGLLVASVFCAFLIVLVSNSTIPFVFAIHNVSNLTGGSILNVNDVSTVYNITIINTDAGGDANITQVNVTFPAGFTFVANSNGTNATMDGLAMVGVNTNFTSTATVLSWTNNTRGLVYAGNSSRVWFSATVSAPGAYIINVTTSNSTGTNYENLTVAVSDTLAPTTAQFTSQTLANNSVIPSSYSIPIGVNATDNGTIQSIRIYVYVSTNFSSTIANGNITGINTTVAYSTTGSYFYNFTGLPAGTYYVNATINDTYGNTNSTETRKFVVGKISPTLFNFNQSITNLYNLSINNANVRTQAGNITYVNITLPSGLSFITASNGTSLGPGGLNNTFSNDSASNQTLSWKNTTDYLINGTKDNNFFWFNATITTPGYYNLTVTTLNGSAAADYNNITLIINDTAQPSIVNFTDQTYANNSALTNGIPIAVNATDNGIIQSISIFVYNSTNALATSVMGLNATYSTTGYYFYNFTGLAAGTYYVNATVNDTYNNANSTETRMFALSITSTTTPEVSGGGLASNTAFWTTTYTLTDAQFMAGQTKDLAVKGRFKFIISNTEHSVGVVSLTSGQATINISSASQQAVFNIGDEKKFDVTGDNYYDVDVKLNSISSGKANVAVKSIHEAIPAPIPAPEEKKTVTEQVTAAVGSAAQTTVSLFKQPAFWVALIMVVVCIALLVLGRKKKRSNRGY